MSAETTPEITLDTICPGHQRPLRDCHPVPFAGINMSDYLVITGGRWPDIRCVRAARTGDARTP